MELKQIHDQNECPRDEISSYIDGELDPGQELELELHFASCQKCTEDLTLQRQFLCALDASLENEPEIELPKDFTRVVVASAESRVSGLRRPTERFNAAFICSGLFLVMMFSIGAASGDALGIVFHILEKTATVASFLGHMAYDVAIGTIIVIRSLSSYFIFDHSPTSFALPAIISFHIYVITRVAALFQRS
jgi:hypothetical protein